MRFSNILFLTLLILTLTTYLASAEYIQLNQASELSDDIEFRLISSDERKVEFEFVLNGFHLEDIVLNGETFKRIIVERAGDLGEVGFPELPALSRMVVMPPSGGARLEVIEMETREFENLNIAPLQPPRWEHEKREPEFAREEEFYRRNEWYPLKRVDIGKPVIMRELRMAPVDFFPVSYNPATRSLNVVTRMKVAVHFEGLGENPKRRNFSYRSESFNPIYKDITINYPPAELDAMPQKKGGYLIISHPNLENELATLMEWKRMKGHNVVWANLQQIGNTYYNIKNYIQTAYDTWDEPPEFVLLVGDVSGTYSLATEYYTNDVTDHKYSLLEGNDYFPDVQVGRISIISEMQLMVIVNKIIKYERNPYMSDPDWFKAALMIACTSHKSCKHTKQWIKQKMLDHGYTRVDTVWYSGWLNTSQVSGPANQGVAYLNYRGYNDWGGFDQGDIYALQNGWKLHVVTGMVCDTGDFGEAECRAEAFLRTGTLSIPNGGVVAFGPASLYTHTKWNNCLDMGFYAGVFDYGIHTASGALNAGKMELWLDYPLNRGPGTTSNSVECYFHQYNTIGDPGLEMWSYTPDPIEAVFDEEINLGTNAFPLSVTYSGSGEPVPEAYVCLYQDGEILSWGATDENGELTLYPEPFSEGEIYLTITKHNHIPINERISVVAQEIYLDVADYRVDDDNSGSSSGNSDGIINPGETIELNLKLSNFGESTASDIAASLNIDNDYIIMLQDESEYADMAAGDSLFAQQDFIFSVSPLAPDNCELVFDLDISYSGGENGTTVDIPVGGPNLVLEEVIQTPDINSFTSGDEVEVVVNLKNQGALSTGEVELTVAVDHPWLTITSPTAVIGPIAPGDTASNYSAPIIIATASEMPPKTPFNLKLTAVDGNGYTQTLDLPLVFGRSFVPDPVGPDEYGYFAFGMEDVAYADCPEYQWVNISTSGTVIDLNEPYGENEDIERIDLPFTFRFYGNEYNYAFVSSNGYITFDNSSVYSFYNFAIPSPLGNDAMIAPFWDDLVVDYGEVRYQYRPSHGALIIAWINTSIYQAGGTNTFQIVLFDPAEHPTPTGDGIIQMQYQVFTNIHSSQNYCTVGIESPDGLDGIEYTFANIYDACAQTLVSNRAIKFTTLYPKENNPPTIFLHSPEELEQVLIGETVIFKVCAYDLESDELEYIWYHNGEICSEAEVCQLTFTEEGQDTVTAVVSDGQDESEYQWIFEVISLEADIPADKIPLEFALYAPAPNPFNPATNIRFDLPKAGKASLVIYDIQGREAARLVDGYQSAGSYSVIFNGSDLASGIYFAELKAEGSVRTIKMVLIK